MLKNLPLRRLAVFFISILLLTIAFQSSGVDHVARQLIRFPTPTLLVILALLTANLFLVSFRFWRQLAHFGIALSWKVALRASLAGYAVSLVMIPLFGQIMGRQAILQNAGVSPVVNASLAAYERTLLAIISATLAVCGGIYLFGQTVVSDFFGHMSLMEIAIAASAGGALSLWMGMSRFEAALSNQMASRKNLARVLWIAGLTLAGQLLMLSCFVLGVLAIRPEVPFLSLLAAAAIISFAASLPITVSGWGVRELAAVYMLGKLGIPAPDAMAVSIMVGLCSILPIIAAIPFVARKPAVKKSVAPLSVTTHNVQEIEGMAAWILGMVTAVAVFFQFHATLPGGGVINLNFADPFAILALAAVSLHSLFSRRLPVWRINRFNLALGLISLLLLLGFIHGWMSIGITQWALGGRLLGWLALLGYLSAGYLISANAGAHGLRRFSETLLATAVVVILQQALIRLLVAWGYFPDLHLTFRFEGYAGNRNAFAFQLLVVMAILLGYSTLYGRHSAILRGSAIRHWVIAFMLGTLLTGLAWSLSRAGILTGAILLAVAAYWRLAERKIIVRSLLFAAMLWSAVWLSGQVHPTVTSQPQAPTLTSQPQASTLTSQPQAPTQSDSSRDASNQERWNTFVHAAELWRQSPIFGVGLGVFNAKSPAWFGYPQVIHNTALWFLAEFGVVGLIVMGWIFFQLTRYAIVAQGPRLVRHALLLLLLAFALFSCVHEIFYQRIFWLVLGALLARPFSAKAAPATGHINEIK